MKVRILTYAVATALLTISSIVASAQDKHSSSVSAISGEDLNADFGQLSSSLAGKIPGLFVIQESGLPGEGAKLMVRGRSTSGADSSPLILVDGSEREIDLVEVEDVDSIYVLKDAAATALYGLRGGNGVVIVTTKHGSVSAPKVSVNADFGVTMPTRLPKLASTEQWLSYYNDLCTQQGVSTPFTPDAVSKYVEGKTQDVYPSVDWVSQTYKPLALTGKVNVKVAGGSERVRYYVGASYYNEGGILNTDKSLSYNPQVSYDKFSFRSNLDVDITRSTLLSLYLSTQYTSCNGPGTSLEDLCSLVLNCTPVAVPVVFSDGRLASPQSYKGINPANEVNAEGYSREARMNAQSLISLTQDFSSFVTPGLKLKLEFAWDAYNGNTKTQYRNPHYYYIDETEPYLDGGGLNLHLKNDGSGYITLDNSVSSVTTYNFEPSISYSRNFNGHCLGVNVLMNMYGRKNNVPEASIYSYYYRHLGFTGTLSYNYKGRYYLDAGFSYSGSNNFEKGYRYGRYPYGAVAYDMSKESYWDGIKDIVDIFKIKGSYGLTGTDQTGSELRRFVYFTSIDTDASSFTFGNSGQNTPNGISTEYLGELGLNMETIRKFNAGVDLRFLGKISLSAEYYGQERDGIFIGDLKNPSILGLGTQYRNLGAVSSRGYEISAAYSDTFDNGFSLSASANYMFNRNKVTSDGRPDQLYPYQNYVGRPYDQQYGLVAIGLFQSEGEIASSPVQDFGEVNVGDIKYQDQNGDHVINSYDMVPIGYTSIPEINYGFGFKMGYKGFDLSAWFAGQANVSCMTGGTCIFGGGDDILVKGQIYEDVALNRWTPAVADASYPRMYLETSTNNTVASTWWQKDMSFLRIKNIELGYTLPEKASGCMGMSVLRVFLSAYNPVCFSSFKLWDPELSGNTGSAYPLMRSFILGLNIKF